jgi:hypothetical protein
MDKFVFVHNGLSQILVAGQVTDFMAFLHLCDCNNRQNLKGMSLPYMSQGIANQVDKARKDISVQEATAIHIKKNKKGIQHVS